MQLLSVPSAGGGLDISGGQETVTVGGFKYVVFTSSGTLTVSGTGTVALCTVGGGGGGGNDISGGGGGAELDLFADFVVASNLTVTVGNAGAGGLDVGSTRGTQGGTSTVVEGVTTHQSALGGGGGGSSTAGQRIGGDGGSGGGGNNSGNSAGGNASGSNTNAGGAGTSPNPFFGGGGGGATAVGSSANGSGGQGYALSSIDANLTSANFPTTLTGKTHVSSGGGGAQFFGVGAPAGGTNAGTGGNSTTQPTTGTSYGCGGGGEANGTNDGAAGFAGFVIARIVA